MKAKLALLVGAASIAASTSAFADDEDRAAPAVKLLTTIPVPVDPAHPANPPVVPLKSFDISWIDADTQLYYLADRSNAAVDVADAKRNVFKKQIRPSGLHVPFKGVAAGGNDFSGPNGVVVSGNWLFVTDAPSRVVAIDLTNDQTKGDLTICLPSKSPCLVSPKRTDELAYDPQDSLILAVNNADEPPFATLIHFNRTTGALTVQNQVVFPEATNGAEQPVWNPRTHSFFISIPQVGDNPQDGAVFEINPQTAAVERRFPVENCQPAGLTLGPNQDLLVGCSVVFDTAGNVWARDPTAAAPSAKPESVIMDARDGRIDRRVQGVGGNDEVWYNPGDGRYYLAARNQPGGSSSKPPAHGTEDFSPVLGIIDAKKMTLDQVVPTVNQPPGSAHSVAVNPHNNHALVPFPANNVAPNCNNGCIAVFGVPTGND